jgi:hypothetical protein
MKLTVYAFEDGDGQEFGTFTTQDYPEAKSYAIRNGLRVVARNFEYSDTEYLDDYTKGDDPFDEEDENDCNV